MTDVFLHNPRCSKSRETLALLKEHGVEPQIIEYLKTPPTKAELKSLITQLGLKPEQLIRKSEDTYREQYAGKPLNDAQWLDAMLAHPVLIERPIVTDGKRAVLGRPPQNVASLLR